MIKTRLTLNERAAAGLVTRHAAGRHTWYLIILAAKYVRDISPYQAAAQIPPYGGRRAGTQHQEARR